jgi:hypothetical protein
MSAANRSVIGRVSADDTNWFPRWWQKNPWMPWPVLQPRLPEGQQHPVDAADLQPHVTGQDLGGGTR